MKCVDINECLNGEWVAKCAKQAECINRPGTYECCQSGFQEDWARPGTCIDVDECKTGEWVSKCSAQEYCLNTLGSFDCCPPGSNNVNGTNQCTDIDECFLKIDQCPYGHQTCINQSPFYNCCTSVDQIATEAGVCESCFTEWEPIPVTEPNRLSFQDKFPSLRKYLQANVSFSFLRCQGYCSTGISVEVRAQSSLSCIGEQTRTPPCNYACTNLTFLVSAEATIGSLIAEFNRGDFLVDVFYSALGIRVLKVSQLTNRKRASSALDIELSNCSNPTAIISLIQGLGADIAPEAPPLSVLLDPVTCHTKVSATDPPSTTPLIVGLVVGLVFLLFAILLALLLMKDKSLVSSLPPEVAWPFKLYEDNKRSWDKRGTERAHYFYKVLKPATTEFQKANDLFKAHQKGPTFTLTTIIGIYNPLLITNFVGAYRIQQERAVKSPHIFNTLDWDKTDNLRAWVYGQYKQWTLQYTWNKADAAPIVPLFHGTDYPIAESICETGFAALSSLDAGFFGKGIYFTPDQVLFPCLVTLLHASWRDF